MSSRILLVEDDPVSRDLLTALLTCKGYQVESAADGFNGLRLAQDCAYDLVFVDYHLPEMDGYAFARLMRSLAERSDHTLRMIAITADQFGLAARRGADTVFDKFLAKPIEPDDLFACVETFLTVPNVEEVAPSDLNDFLGEPTSQDAQTASQVLWRVRGMSNLPNAAIFPAPTAAERQGLSYCFTITGPENADCLVALNDGGVAEIAALRQSGARYLLPVFGVEQAALPACDAAFHVGDPKSWTDVARIIKTVQLRTVLLKGEIRSSNDFDMRLLAYMFVAERAILLRRDSFGRISVSYTAGFDADSIIAAVKRLASKQLIASRSGEAASDGTKELSIALNERGLACILDARMSHDKSTAS